MAFEVSADPEDNGRSWKNNAFFGVPLGFGTRGTGTSKARHCEVAGFCGDGRAKRFLCNGPQVQHGPTMNVELQKAAAALGIEKYHRHIILGAT